MRNLLAEPQLPGITKAVIGVSGGVDSAQALIVTARAMDRLGLSRTNVLGFSMPGFATSERTRTNALALMRALGVTANEIDIRPSCLQMLKDLGHPSASGQKVYDVTFENVQAGERTSHLFRLANQHGGLVVGTSGSRRSSSQEQGAAGPVPRANPSLARSSCRISSCATSAASATGRVAWCSWRSTRDAIAHQACGRKM